MENINRFKLLLSFCIMLSIVCSGFLVYQQYNIADQPDASLLIHVSIQEIKAVPDVIFVKDVIHAIFNIVKN